MNAKINPFYDVSLSLSEDFISSVASPLSIKVYDFTRTYKTTLNEIKICLYVCPNSGRGQVKSGGG